MHLLYFDASRIQDLGPTFVVLDFPVFVARIASFPFFKFRNAVERNLFLVLGNLEHSVKLVWKHLERLII